MGPADEGVDGEALVVELAGPLKRCVVRVADPLVRERRIRADQVAAGDRVDLRQARLRVDAELVVAARGRRSRENRERQAVVRVDRVRELSDGLNGLRI